MRVPEAHLFYDTSWSPKISTGPPPTGHGLHAQSAAAGAHPDATSAVWSSCHRQWSRNCWVAEYRVAVPPRAGVASAMRGKMRSRARTSHVWSRSRACRRQVRALAQLEEAAMGTRRCVGICVASSWRMSRPGGRPGQRRACLRRGGAGLPAASAASTAEEHLGPGHQEPICGQFVAGHADPQVVGV